MLFSERYGFKPIRKALQIKDMDEPLRNGLWNAWLNKWYYGHAINKEAVFEVIWTELFKRPTDTGGRESVVSHVKTTFQQSMWFKTYDILEYCNHILPKKAFIIECNRILEREMSAYRFVDGQLTAIVSEIEISAVEQATQDSEGNWSPVTQHIRASLAMLSDRQQPDYRNSVKEAISSVEAACQIITNNTKATLGDTLKTLEQKGQLHKALKEGFNKLYGYTSDAGGIRHALTDDSHIVTFDEAKFMLVTCSAFVNYLRPKME